MNPIGASSDTVPVDEGTRQRGAASGKCAAGSQPMAGEIRRAMGDIDFSRANLQYLLCARDLARDYPKRAAVSLGATEALVQRLAELDPAALVAVTEVKAPLLVLRQETWWWDRLFTALQAGRPDELRAVLDQAGLMVAKDGPRGSDACA